MYQRLVIRVSSSTIIMSNPAKNGDENRVAFGKKMGFQQAQSGLPMLLSCLTCLHPQEQILFRLRDVMAIITHLRSSCPCPCPPQQPFTTTTTTKMITFSQQSPKQSDSTYTPTNMTPQITCIVKTTTLLCFNDNSLLHLNMFVQNRDTTATATAYVVTKQFHFTSMFSCQ